MPAQCDRNLSIWQDAEDQTNDTKIGSTQFGNQKMFPFTYQDVKYNKRMAFAETTNTVCHCNCYFAIELSMRKYISFHQFMLAHHTFVI